MATEPKGDLVEAFRSAGDTGPCYAEVAMCCAERDEHARNTAHRYFRWSVTGWPVQAELPDTKGFAAASKHVSPEAVAEHITCGPSPEHHLKAIRQFIKAGFDHIILVQIGPDQEYFLDFFKRKLAPTLRGKS